MNKPSVTEGAGFIHYSWPDLGLRVEAARYKDDGYTELKFYLKNGAIESLLHQTRVNVLATQTMSSLAKRLEKNSSDISWTDVLTYITTKTMEIVRRGEPLIEIFPNEKANLQPNYLLEPIIYQSHPNVIFGDYGSLKSMTALAIAYIVQLPLNDNVLGLITSRESSRCLYLDYEDDITSFEKRWGALQKGFGITAAMPILYRRMTAPIADSVEQIRLMVSNKNIKLLIIDSLGPGVRGNLNDAEPAVKYHEALRIIDTTSLTLAHCSKDQLTKKRSIFGSVFFSNLARSVWEIKSEAEPGENEAIISLKQVKANLSKLCPPLGYKFTFSENTVSIAKIDLKDTGLSGELPLSLRIKNLLRHGAMPVKDIAEALDANEASVKTINNRLSKKGHLIKVGNAWGLKQLT